MSAPKPPGEWNENSEITKYLNILQGPLNELGHKWGAEAPNMCAAQPAGRWSQD
jgi:hypothetical protein